MQPRSSFTINSVGNRRNFCDADWFNESDAAAILIRIDFDCPSQFCVAKKCKNKAHSFCSACNSQFIDFFLRLCHRKLLFEEKKKSKNKILT